MNRQQRRQLARLQPAQAARKASSPGDGAAADLFAKAFRHFQDGRLTEAEELCRRIISVKRDAFDALHILAVIQSNLGRMDEALTYFDRALALQPNNAGFLYNRSVTLQEMQRYEEALASYERALSLQPDHVEALNNRGVVLKELKRFDEALVSYDRALSVRPSYVEAIKNRGHVLQELKRYEEALASYERALMARPDDFDVLTVQGNMLQELWRYEEALAKYEQALAVQPDHAGLLNNRGNMLKELKRHEEALASFEKALKVQPDYGDALYNCGSLHAEHKRYGEAFAAFDRALAVNSNLKFLAGMRLHTKMQLCDWNAIDEECARLVTAMRQGRRVVVPFTMLAVPVSAGDHLQCARIFTAEKCPVSVERIWQGERYSHERIRVAYVSADFRDHAVANLLAGLFEQHDRSRFETIAISLRSDDRSAMRARLKGAFDRFIDVHDKSDRAVARLMRELEVDIAVDLMGFTTGCRPSIFAHRPAPIQASYLGYPGTSGSEFIDYFIGDRIVLPFDQQPFFTEKIVHLPDCFMPADSKQAVARAVSARGNAGLPDDAFVFCSFSEGYKITAAMFDIWMRLLRNVEGSVLWLLHSNDAAAANLRRQAEARGVEGDRLIFAPKLGRAEHLARISLADVFLNTHPVNAGANAIDALSAGLPIVSYVGDTFVQRVTASLLHAVGLPELAVQSLEDYEALALRLARNSGVLAEIKAKLARNRDTHPLFDTARVTRHIEAAYTTMWEKWQRGEAPNNFSVVPAEFQVV